MPLILEPRPAQADDIYAALVAMHEGLTDEESAHADARLILILANHIGDPAIIAKAAAIARGDQRRDRASI